MRAPRVVRAADAERWFRNIAPRLSWRAYRAERGVPLIYRKLYEYQPGRTAGQLEWDGGRLRATSRLQGEERAVTFGEFCEHYGIRPVG